MLGPPGAGKGTQAAKIAAGSWQPVIYCVKPWKLGPKTGLHAKEIMERGDVPDDLVVAVVADRLDEPDAANGFVLDGFPRTLAQAEALDEELYGRGLHPTTDIVAEQPCPFSLWSRPNGRGVSFGATVQISHRGNPGSTVSPETAVERSADGHPSLKLTGVNGYVARHCKEGRPIQCWPGQDRGELCLALAVEPPVATVSPSRMRRTASAAATILPFFELHR